MTRYEFESENKQYLYVIGIDDFSATYVQIYDQVLHKAKKIFEANRFDAFVLDRSDLTGGQSLVLGQIEAACDKARKQKLKLELDVEQLYHIALEFNVNLNPSLIAAILNGDLDE